MQHQPNISIGLVSFVLLSLMLVACGDENGPINPKSERIAQITDIQLKVLNSQLTIIASGIVRTGGWSAPVLVQYQYITPPADGIYEFDFLAKPPEGVVTQALTDIEASFVIDPLPDTLLGVKIYAETNDMEKMLK